MIVITGATGQLGGAALDRLLEHVPASEVAVSVRDPGRARAIADRGVRVRRGDFTDPASLMDAFEDVTQLLLVSGAAGAATHRTAIAAAVTAGAERIVYTAHMAAHPDSAFWPARGHGETEQDLAASGVAWTSLHDGFHATSAPYMLGSGLERGEVAVPADGPTAWTAQEDLAAAAVVALLEPDRLSGITPPLTGSEALDLADLARVVAQLTGRPVRRTIVPDDEYLDGLIAGGTPAEYAPLLASYFPASRAGEFATVDPTLAELLGREPIQVREVLARRMAA